MFCCSLPSLSLPKEFSSGEEKRGGIALALTLCESRSLELSTGHSLFSPDTDFMEGEEGKEGGRGKMGSNMVPERISGSN